MLHTHTPIYIYTKVERVWVCFCLESIHKFHLPNIASISRVIEQRYVCFTMANVDINIFIDRWIWWEISYNNVWYNMGETTPGAELSIMLMKYKTSLSILDTIFFYYLLPSASLCDNSDNLLKRMEGKFDNNKKYWIMDLKKKWIETNPRNSSYSTVVWGDKVIAIFSWYPS